MPVLQKYLSRYGEPEIDQLTDFPSNIVFDNGLVVPVYQEDAAIIDRFSKPYLSVKSLLIIMVLNRPDNDQQGNWAEGFYNHPTRQNKQLWQSTDQLLTLYQLNNHCTLMLVDRCLNGPPISPDQGVGLARKLGADLLCQLIVSGVVTSPWIANTDADAELPDDYFVILNRQKSAAAVVFPFEHIVEANQCELSIRLYEYSLNYYVQGILWAQSPYAFHTIGSTIAIHHHHYAQVRGFPKRSGAEDFYVLNKLAKTGTVRSLDKPRIKLEARASHRVPFGTGPAVTKLHASPTPLSMSLYHPDCFLFLKIFQKLQHILAVEQCDLTTAIKQLNTTKDLNPLIDTLQRLGFQAALDHSYQHGKLPVTRLRHLEQWFDAFKTLKFIHLLRDFHFGTVSYQELQDHSFESPLANNKTLTKLAKQISQLPEK